MGQTLSVECCQVRDHSESFQGEVWYDCDSEQQEYDSIFYDAVDGLHTKAATLEAGVPPEAADDVVQLAVLVSAHAVEPMSDPLTLLRFYISCNGIVEDAARMYRNSVKWRCDYALGKVMALHGSGEAYCADGSPAHSNGETEWHWARTRVTFEAETFHRHGFYGRLQVLNHAKDEGGPILVWRIGQADIGMLDHEEALTACKRGLAAHLEDCFQCSRSASLKYKRLVLSRLVLDCHGLQLATALRYSSHVKELVECSIQYPEAVKSITVVRAPKTITAVWRFLSRLLKPAMRAKFEILGDDFAEGLKAHSGLHVDVLPRFLGGKAKDDEVCSAEKVSPAALKAFLDKSKCGEYGTAPKAASCA